MINYAYAQAAAQPPSMWKQLIPLILIFIIFYFLLIRPQQKRQKEHNALLAAIKRGDEIMSGGGIIGKVTKVENDKLSVEISKGVIVTIIRSQVADVVKKK